MNPVYSPFVRRYRSQAFRIVRRRPQLIRVLIAIPGFTYVRIGNFVFWRDGWRIGVGREGAV